MTGQRKQKKCLTWVIETTTKARLSIRTYPHLFQFSSVTQSCLTLCDSMDCSTPGFPVHHQHPESTQTHVHRVGDAIQPSHPLSSPSPPALNLSQHQGLFKYPYFLLRASCAGLVAQSCPTLATSWTVVCQAPLSRISQARILDWVTISFSRQSLWPRYWTQALYFMVSHLSC